MNAIYDCLIADAGLYGAVFAREAAGHGKSVIVVDKRPHIAGEPRNPEEQAASLLADAPGGTSITT